jgi:threonine synthase
MSSLRSSYILDPHTAMGVVLARRIYERTPSGSRPPVLVILSTAHAAKFPDAGGPVPEPEEIKNLRGRPTRKQECDVEGVQETVTRTLAARASAARL